MKRQRAIANQVEVKSIEEDQQSRRQVIMDILDRIDQSAKHVEDISKGFLLTSTDR